MNIEMKWIVKMSFPMRKYAFVYGYIHHLFAMSNNVWVIITLFVIHSKNKWGFEIFQ
jgi:hypothetical protein